MTCAAAQRPLVIHLLTSLDFGGVEKRMEILAEQPETDMRHLFCAIRGGGPAERRLNGLTHECELQRRELARTDPESPRIDQLANKIADLNDLAAFALPLMRTLAAWPVQAAWAEWLSLFEALAPRVLARPDRVFYANTRADAKAIAVVRFPWLTLPVDRARLRQLFQ